MGSSTTVHRPQITPAAEFAISEQSLAFMRRYYPDASVQEWCDWKWQMRRRLRSIDELSRVFELSGDETEALLRPKRPFPVSVTPYYASLMDRKNAESALRRTMLPVPDEFTVSKGEMSDPLAEDKHAPVPGIVHRYPDRVLFLITDFCPVYCRYCTRSRLVGGNAEFEINLDQWQRGIDYIAATPTVRDVLVSGGDPLIYSDDRLDWLLQRLHAIPHLDMIRLGTKIPIALPQRITPAFTDMLKRYHPLYISLHVNHPDEITPESAQACERLADAGVPLGSQTVLLKGVNDDPEVIRKLMHELLKIRVRPYYLLQCDPITGSAHFRTPVQRGVEIIRALRGHTTGYAVPHFIIDTPDGGGKFSVVPEYIDGRDGDDLLITNYEGRSGFRYPDPVS
jgi:lysine 2,3-aminomutase